MTGLPTRFSVRFTVATSSSNESRPYWTEMTSCPSACNAGITLLKQEPSAQMPWQKTIVGLVDIRASADQLPGRPAPTRRQDQRQGSETTSDPRAYSPILPTYGQFLLFSARFRNVAVRGTGPASGRCAFGKSD